MASIKRIEGKTGVSFLITVAKGRDETGKQIRHYLTWKPDSQMTEKQMEKAVNTAASDFEKQIESGYKVDDRQTFSEYAKYVLRLKKNKGVKISTLERYEELLVRINGAIGHLKLSEIRPKHLNDFYTDLAEKEKAKVMKKARSITDLSHLLSDAKQTRRSMAESTGVSSTTITAACQGKNIDYSTAKKIAEVLSSDFSSIFEEVSTDEHLSTKTILEHHRLIHTVLETAEKEMILSYNPADKASPPKNKKPKASYFQPDEIARIRDALMEEPFKWRVATHLLLVTGCRRGEIMGLRWSKVDFEHNYILINSEILYNSNAGIYEDTTKTDSSYRYVTIPPETTELLKEYKQFYDSMVSAAGDRWIGGDFLFCRDDGTPSSPDSITAWLKKFSDRHDLPHVSPKAFRHTMASILIKNGTDVVSVSKRLGHSKTSTTTDIYSHIIAEADAEASECIADKILR